MLEIKIKGNTITIINDTETRFCEISEIKPALNFMELICKKILDIVVGSIILFVLFPVFIFVGILIKIDSNGPIFFKQQRIGFRNKPFAIWKFRTMYSEKCDKEGGLSTQKDDSRITKVGSFLRKSSLDELPQIINVLKGDMSLIGPRPHAIGSMAGGKFFWEISPNYWSRHAVPSGITGLAQIKGFRGSTFKQKDLIKRLEKDMEYIESYSFISDLKILFKTILVIFHKNAF